MRASGNVFVAFPVRMLSLTVIIGAVLLLSTIVFAALLSISLAYAALVSCRYVLPAADRLEGRMTAARQNASGRTG